jgi:hypothetical protein
MVMHSVVKVEVNDLATRAKTNTALDIANLQQEINTALKK